MYLIQFVIYIPISISLSLQIGDNRSLYCLILSNHKIQKPLDYRPKFIQNRLKYSIIPTCTVNGTIQIKEKIHEYFKSKVAIYIKNQIKNYIKEQSQYLLDCIKEPFIDIVSRIKDEYYKLCSNRDESLNCRLPLRHRKWRIRYDTPIKYSERAIDNDLIEFFDDGRVVASSGIKGYWWTDYGDIVWKLPLDNDTNRSIYFNAQICWNNFSKTAFMRRGVVFKDRQYNSWIPVYMFRPVLCKFVAYGIEEEKDIIY